MVYGIIRSADRDFIQTGRAKMFCIHCGGTLPDGAAFCPSCGKKVINYSSAVHTQTAKSIFRPGVCPACGSNQLKVLRPGVYLCEHCGTKSFSEEPAALEDDAPLDVRVAVLLKEAEEYSANKDLKNELLSLSKALPLAPENYSVLFYLGRCYSRLDLYDKALECFRKADALYPNDPDVTVMLGTVNMNRGNTVEAKGYYEKVLKMIEEKQVPVSSSTAVTVYVSYGHCLGRLGDKEAALKYFSLAKENGYSQSGIEPYCKELGLDPDLV